MRGFRSLNPFLPLFVFIAAALPYLNILPNGFLADDHFLVETNPWIKDIRHLPDIFRSEMWGFSQTSSNYYRPVVHVLYMLGYRLFGPDAWGFHLMSILFHAGTSAMVFIVCRALFKTQEGDRGLGVPLMASVLFAFHPVHTEAVAWIAALTEPAYSFFFLVSFYFYMRAGRESGPNERQKGIFFGFSLLFFALALFSKEPAILLPLAIAAYDIFVLKEKFARRARSYIPYFVIIAFYLLLRANALNGMLPWNAHEEMGLGELFPAIIFFLAKYIGKLAFPFGLNSFYGIIKYSPAQLALSALVSAGLTVLLIISLKKSAKVFFLMLFALLPLLPAFYIRGICGNTFAERYLYLPSAGFLMLAGLGLERLRGRPRWKKPASAGFISIALLFGALTIARNPVWENDYTLWGDVVGKSPHEPVAHRNYGIQLSKRGLSDAAIRHFMIVLSMYPSDPETHHNLGRAYTARNRLEEALQEYRISHSMLPELFDTNYELGAVLLKLGRYQESVPYMEAALRLKPGDPDANLSLGVALYHTKKFGEAERELRRCLYLDRENHAVHYMLGLTLREMGSEEEARRELAIAEALRNSNRSVTP